MTMLWGVGVTVNKKYKLQILLTFLYKTKSIQLEKGYEYYFRASHLTGDEAYYC